jgi:CO/xanthine dehydrogenase FAD-binding subunit
VVVEEAATLKGKKITAADIEMVAQAARKRARPLGNVSEIGPKYRREMVGVYVKKAFEQLFAGAPA